jgi:hypothetical protein
MAYTAYTNAGAQILCRYPRNIFPTLDLREQIMATIKIKDLTESVDLDREAMLAITGGSRFGRHIPAARTILRTSRIVNYPAGFASAAPANIGGQTSKGTSRK